MELILKSIFIPNLYLNHKQNFIILISFYCYIIPSYINNSILVTFLQITTVYYFIIFSYRNIGPNKSIYSTFIFFLIFALFKLLNLYLTINIIVLIEILIFCCIINNILDTPYRGKILKVHDFKELPLNSHSFIYAKDLFYFNRNNEINFNKYHIFAYLNNNYIFIYNKDHFEKLKNREDITFFYFRIRDIKNVFS